MTLAEHARRGRGGRRLFAGLWWAFVAASNICVFVPLMPLFPAEGLDPSWAMALNEAVAQHLVFGRDIAVTYGPYSSVFYALYHPATDALTVWMSLLLALAYAWLLFLLARDTRAYWLPLQIVVLSAYGWVNFGTRGYLVRDAYMFSFCLLVALVAYRMSAEDCDRCRVDPTTTIKVLFLASAAMIGLLPLIKGSFLPIVACTVAVACWLFVEARSWPLAVGVLLLPCASSFAFWRLAGQPWLALPRYLTTMILTISGFTEAMALYPNRPAEEWFYGISALLSVIAVLCGANGSLRRRLLLAGIYSASLFVVFKAGFVRHDEHALAAGEAILLYTLLVAAVIPFEFAIIPIAVALFAWGTIDRANVGSSPAMLRANFVGSYTTAFRGLAARLGSPSSLEETFRTRMTAIANSLPIPRLDGSADLYSYQQAFLLASPNVWSPRPVIQSYAAYAPALLEMNARHLLGPQSPDHILFRIEPIDGRLPSLDDGLSWPALLTRYATRNMIGTFVHLARREGGTAPSFEAVYQGVHSFDDEIDIPQRAAPVFAEFDVAPSLWGRLQDGLFKRPQINISLTLVDGRTALYRFVSGMGRTPFLISPMVTNDRDFVLLSGNPGYLDDNRVKSVRLVTTGGGWRPSFAVRLSTLAIPRTDISAFGLLDPIVRDTDGRERTLANCDCHIDALNGRSESAANVTIHGTLSIAGWAVISGKAPVSSDAVFVTLTDAAGTETTVRARSVPRPDVRQALRLPDSAETGFEAFFDVSQLSGTYSLGIARRYGNDILACRQLSLRVVIQ